LSLFEPKRTLARTRLAPYPRFRSVIVGTVTFVLAGAMVTLAMSFVRLYRSIPEELFDMGMGV
jgi:hypothetical protein